MVGITQPQNFEHKDFIENCYRNLGKLPKDRFLILDQWTKDYQEFKEILLSCDIGLNISKDSVENFQSMRMRVSEYIKAGMPWIQSEGGYWGRAENSSYTYLIQPGNHQSYLKVLNEIEFRNFASVDRKKNALSKARHLLSKNENRKLLFSLEEFLNRKNFELNNKYQNTFNLHKKWQRLKYIIYVRLAKRPVLLRIALKIHGYFKN